MKQTEKIIDLKTEWKLNFTFAEHKLYVSSSFSENAQIRLKQLRCHAHGKQESH